MFGNILGKKKQISQEDTQNKELIAKISKMNLTEMRSYIKNNIDDFEVSEEGLIAILKKLTTEDEKTKKYYLKSDDMDSKKKKAFDLVILMAQSKRINFEVVELMQRFIETYNEIITQYDRDHKEIYASRFVDAINLALENINKKAILQNKMNLLGENKSSI
jgi:Ni,Fe-hydrogenase III component G